MALATVNSTLLPSVVLLPLSLYRLPGLLADRVIGDHRDAGPPRGDGG